jgi:hypothetical protein
MSRRKYYFSQKPSEAREEGKLPAPPGALMPFSTVAVFIRYAWFL